MDIFDKIMHLPIFGFIEPFYKKNKEVLLYLLFGGLTFIVSILSYSFFCMVYSMNELVSNIISWILAVTFAYVTNRTWVFGSNAKGFNAVSKEAVYFYLGRVVTLVIEEIILFVFITIMGFNNILVKVIAQVIIIILNYVISKLAVFGGKEHG